MGKIFRMFTLLTMLSCFHSSFGEEYHISSTKLSKEQCQVIDTLYNRFSLEFTKESYFEALSLAFQMVDSLTAYNDVENLISYYQSLFFVFIKMERDTLMYKYLTNLVELRKQVTNIETYRLVDLYYARYYYSKKNYEKSIQKLNFCLRDVDRFPNLITRASVYVLLGDVYANAGRFGLANFNYNIALRIFSGGNYDMEMSNIYTKIAHIHQVLGQNKENLLFNQKALPIRLKAKNIRFLSYSYLNIGQAFWLLNQNDSAWYYLNKSLELSLTQQGAYLTEICYRSLRSFCISVGRNEEAFRYDQKYARYHTKSLYTKNNTEISILLADRAVYEREISNERIKQEITLKNLLIKNKKNQTISLGISVIAFLSLAFFIDFMIRVNKKKKEGLSLLNQKLRREIYENEVATGLLHESEELHRFLAENTSDIIILLDANLRKIYVSRSCEKLYGYTSQEIMKMKNFLELIDIPYQPAFNLHLLEMIQVRQPNQCIHKAVCKDRSTFWAEANFNPVIDQSRKSIREIILVIRDYGERKKFEEDLSLTVRQKEIMLKEIHNRVKNNFAILGSLVNMVMNQRHNQKLTDAYNDLHLRIRTMSLVHEQLYKSQEINIIPLESYLQNLCTIIAGTFRTNRIEMITNFASCRLSIENTLPIGLIINELLINSFKYAFPDETTGTISISLFPERENYYCITISDNGIGLPEDFSSKITKSMGTQIVNLLVQQIDGTLSVSNNNGACFKLIFPVRT